MKRARTGRFVKRKAAKAAPRKSRKTTKKAASPSIASLVRALKAEGFSVQVIKPRKSGKAKRSR